MPEGVECSYHKNGQLSMRLFFVKGMVKDGPVNYFDGEECESRDDFLNRTFDLLSHKLEWILCLAVREFMLRLRLPNDGPTEELVLANLKKLIG